MRSSSDRRHATSGRFAGPPRNEIAGRLSRLEAQEVPRREARQDPDSPTEAARAVDTVMLRARDGDGAIVALLAAHRDLDVRIRERTAVPRAGPVVGRHVELAVGPDAGYDPVVRGSVPVEGGDDQGRAVSGL